MTRGMSDRSSEVKAKHALAGTEGHSHLVIWVNYKWGRLQQGKMSWTAVCPETHINRSTAHMDCSLCWAPDPVGLSWMKRPQWQPGETEEKFTNTTAKMFYTLSPLKVGFSLCLSAWYCIWNIGVIRFQGEKLMFDTCHDNFVSSRFVRKDKFTADTKQRCPITFSIMLKHFLKHRILSIKKRNIIRYSLTIFSLYCYGKNHHIISHSAPI